MHTFLSKQVETHLVVEMWIMETSILGHLIKVHASHDPPTPPKPLSNHKHMQLLEPAWPEHQYYLAHGFPQSTMAIIAPLSTLSLSHIIVT